jgi:hypothetical protein
MGSGCIVQSRHADFTNLDNADRSELTLIGVEGHAVLAHAVQIVSGGLWTAHRSDDLG